MTNNEQNFNLLMDPFIPISSTRSKERIRVYEITQDYLDKESDIDSPRQDMQSAFYQLMISIFQTIYPPKDEKHWLELWKNPPKTYELKEIMEQYSECFNLYPTQNVKYAFMQDVSITDAEKFEIGKLLPGFPGKETIKDNKDIFAKRDSIELLCQPCTAIAIFLKQITGIGDGQGYRKGLRKDGPMTTILSLPSSFGIWRRIWINIFPMNHFEEDNNPISEDIYSRYESLNQNNLREKIFPWMGLVDFLERDKKAGPYYVGEQDTHILHQYWSAPSRVLLCKADQRKPEQLADTEDNDKLCSICQEPSIMFVKQIALKNITIPNDSETESDAAKKSKKVSESGSRYFLYSNTEGTLLWQRHPFTPYRKIKDVKTPVSAKDLKNGNGWQHYYEWLMDDSGRSGIVKYYFTTRKRTFRLQNKESPIIPTIWASGYDVSSSKTKGYYESKLPIFSFEDGDENGGSKKNKDFQPYVKKILEYSKEAENELCNQIKNVIKAETSDKKLDKKRWEGYRDTLSYKFWQESEPIFYSYISKLYNEFGKNDPKVEENLKEILRKKLDKIKGLAEGYFKELVFVDSMFINPDRKLKEIFSAWENLQGNLNKKKREIIGRIQ